MTIPTRPAPPPPENNHHQQNGGVNNQNYEKITITLPPPPSSKNKIRPQGNIAATSTQNYGSISVFSKRENNNNDNNRSITRNFPQAKTRYAPTTDWSGSSFDLITNNPSLSNKKAPPPRPPPPKTPLIQNESKFKTGSGIVKNSRPPQSVNVLSNLFGRRKSPATVNNASKLPAPKIPQLSSSQISANSNSSGTINNLFPDWSCNQGQRTFSSAPNVSPHNFDSHDVQLINFDSPPNSPTFTQKSNSDCVSVDSFSSDSNFSSPHNGSASQPESGFEDDFSTTNASSTSSTQLTTPVDPWDILHEPRNINGINNSGQVNYMHLNNMKNIDAHPIRNLHILQRKNNENLTFNTVNGKNVFPPQQKLGMPTIIRPKIQKSLAPKPPGQMECEMSKFSSQSSYLSRNLETITTYDFQSSYENEDPPMPNCPPPPPPLDLQKTDFNIENSGAEFLNQYNNFESDDSHESPYGITMYNFDGVEVEDLSFKENEKIYLLSRLNEDWFMGKNKKGCEGIFPSSYIEIKIPLKQEDGAKSKHCSVENSNKALTVERCGNDLHDMVKVLYTFEASQPGDLTILENEIVKVLYCINEDWLYGEKNNEQGQFPANFVEKIPDN